ncbi:RagB/SusD family nutrient uptake outer membrane protein [Pinibacter soli]|uniref:RagB/SusD family nutrient uptake outer membrane protein n=1 Tax=Pinibacter soli TaxID=3044211 RepID=A0ABT6RBC4_9BACT|nr:RagB/SusD family nutrient uptake outer membrane protein [Pinibacter soli]MDI3319214.1 RagB/SusD family nutrient uptake outer membrane protein [Pinibacter soli]
MRVFKAYKYIVPALALSAMIASCNKLVDVAPKDVLEEKNMYRNVFDADAAVIGVYGKFMSLATPYIVLNEVRADLMSTTATADEYLKQLNEHDVKEGNLYANPKPFYTVIMNCNDVMANFDIMLRDKKLKQEEYNMRYSDIAALRSWVYLQLGIQFGSVPYVTDPLSTTTDMQNVGLMPRIPFNQLLDELIKTMEGLPYIKPYSATSSLVATVDGYTTKKFFVNKEALLGELYLWRNDYHKAASILKNLMETGGTGDLYNYRLTGASKADNNDLAVGYVRYREEDEGMLIDNNSQGWRSMFARDEDAMFDREWVWFLPFNKSFDPVDPFVDLFSNRGGSYKLKPSQYALDTWNAQVQKNDFAYDARGKVFTARSIDGQPVVMKYLYNYLNGTGFTPLNVFEKNGKWFLYRAASMHLDFAEAANRDNHQSLAYAIVNQGLTTIPKQITGEGFPYNFDARKSDNPKITGDWCLNVGVRGRANLYSQTVTGDSTLSIEEGIVSEAGLELASEGRRWSDLLRVALRRNDPAFLANKVYEKLVRENNPRASEVRAKLMNKDNWYLPFKWK